MAKIPGYAGQFLEVDLTNKTTKTVPVDPNLARQYIGGRALGVRMLLDAYGSNWAKIDPLGPDAILYLFGGPLSSYAAVKTVAIFKSPESGGAIGSAMSGDFTVHLKWAGYDGLILKGKAAAPTVLLIEDDKIKFEDGSKVWGKNTDETQKYVTDTYGPLHDSLYIGPGGENLVKFASIMTCTFRACGRGGSGAVMGSKNLKAVVVRGTGPSPDVADTALLKKTMDWNCVYPLANGGALHEYGTTSGIYTTPNGNSSGPVKNWQSEWHDNVEVRGEMFADKIWVKRYWADYGCTVACSKVGRIKSGKRAGHIAELPDYEAGAYMGAGLGITDVNEVTYMADVPDKLGLDVIASGAVLGYAAECYEKGVLTQTDLGGIDLKWGNTDGFEKLATMIAKREGIGATLADGVRLASQKIGKGSEAWAVHVKGIEVGAHGVRSGKDFLSGLSSIAYACSTQGGDHVSTAGKTSENFITNDTYTTCFFAGADAQHTLDYINSITGFGITQDEINTKLQPMWTTVQMITVRLAGWTIKDDTNPPRFYEPLPDGPFKGKITDKAVEDQQKQDYYKALGWDAKGIPTTDTLKKYGLEALDAALAPMRA